MSSVATAPEEAPSRPSETTPPSRARRGGLSGDFALGLLGAIALAAVEFVAGGGNDLAPNTWVQGGLVLLAAIAVITVALIGAPGRAWGAWALIAFTALAALTYASIAWSVQPYNSWNEANRTLSYLAAFATALMLARFAPGRWRALLGALATGATVACGYALLVKVFPGTLDPNDSLGRLQAPFGYWNAVGLMAAIGLPACLWAGARREPAPVLRALAPPAIAILIAALVLSLSRGAVLAAVVGLATWFALAPLRLRSALVLGVGAAGGAAISAWGLAHRGISADKVGEAARISAGHGFGVVVLVALVLTAAGGVGVRVALDRVDLPYSLRRRIGAVLVGLAALIPVGGVLALAESSRGLTGEVSHLWSELTNPNGGISNSAGRLVQLSNSHAHYWRVALKIGEHHPLAGVGALGFETAQLRYGGDTAATYHADHAHGYVVETFADFGAIGLAISLAALVTWLLATATTFEVGWPRRGATRPRPPPDGAREAERAGLIALLAIVLSFGVHSTIDWTWFIPGNAVVALVCAGWLAGRGPLSRPTGRRPQRRLLSRSPAAVGAVALVGMLTLAALFVIVQPLRSWDSYLAAFTANNGAAAFTDARNAAAEDPVSVDPLFLLSQLDSSARDQPAAREALVEAVSRQPANPETWQQLGCYELGRHQTAAASGALRHVLVLNPGDRAAIQSNPGLFCLLVTG